MNWYEITNVNEIDTPSLAVYVDRVKHNINTLVNSIDDVKRLRPHIKTHKSREVSAMMLHAGIEKFKCATIAEAEMLAGAGAKDILLAYQPVGPKATRLLTLTSLFPEVAWSCLVDNINTAKNISDVFSAMGKRINAYIDVNVGMNRTGITPDKVVELFTNCQSLSGISIVGLHAYDGHLRDSDFSERKKKCDQSFAAVEELQRQLESRARHHIRIVAGGTPTYSIHSKRKDIECSPGTFIYWDRGYEQVLQEQQYLHAALVLTRVISVPADNIICTDLGHKAIASENPLTNRVYFLNAPELEPIGHSEEHMVFRNTGQTIFKVGAVLYGVPFHVCPTVALHDVVNVVKDNQVSEQWLTEARRRRMSV